MTENRSTALPDDDLSRSLVKTRVEETSLPHVGVAGGTYTIVISGAETAGAYTLIDMLVPPNSGPGPHRHDFEELFIIQEGELEFTFRGQTTRAYAGEIVNIPANAPHRFQNVGESVAHLLCMCTPAAQDAFFLAVGEPLPSRDAHPSVLDGTELEKWISTAAAAASSYRTELL